MSSTWMNFFCSIPKNLAYSPTAPDVDSFTGCLFFLRLVGLTVAFYLGHSAQGKYEHCVTLQFVEKFHQ